MREFKFRCYDKNESYMLPWEHLMDAGDLSEMLKFGHEEDAEYSKLMQYTGLKDKNGVEIYEGDIVTATFWDDEQKIYSETAIVDFEEGSFILKIPNDEWSYFNGTQSVEVIGNIHEHSRLLEGEAE